MLVEALELGPTSLFFLMAVGNGSTTVWGFLLTQHQLKSQEDCPDGWLPVGPAVLCKLN